MELPSEALPPRLGAARTGVAVSESVYWFVELAVRPGALTPFLQLTQEMVEASLQEPGTLTYERALSPDQTLVIAHERYRDSNSAMSHLRRFHQEYSARFDALVERRRFTVVGEVSDELRQMLAAVGATFALPSTGFSRLVAQQEPSRSSD
jgi:quinol monooxygenase YgiN